jgi:hypothetical protein
MPGARGFLTAPPYQTPGQLKMAALRAMVGKTGRTTRTEALKAAKLQTAKDIVQTVVDRKRGIVTTKDITALAKVTGASRLEILTIVETAKETFSRGALEYVNIHKEATQAALANGDAKSLDVATRAAQWAIEKLSHEGTRILDAPQAGPANTGTKIMIGIQLGGKNPSFIEAETPSEHE